MEKYIAYSNNATGRDKLFRLAQYSSKLLGWILETDNRKDLVKLLGELEKSLSTSRKLFRFGRSIESVRAAQRAINLQSYVLSLTLTVSHTNKALYLLIDHYIWLGRVGVLSIDHKTWGDRSSRFWLLSLILAFIRDLYALKLTMDQSLESKMYERPGKSSTPADKLQALFNAIKRNPQATIDIVKNGCDIVIPAKSLGLINVNNGIVGLCGVISTLLAALQVANPSLKLKPN